MARKKYIVSLTSRYPVVCFDETSKQLVKETSEPGYRRPVLVVQDDTFIQSRISTVIVVIITSNIQLAAALGNVLLPRERSGLSKDSVANVSQIFTIDKTFLVERIGSLPDYLQEEIDEGLRTILYL